MFAVRPATWSGSESTKSTKNSSTSFWLPPFRRKVFETQHSDCVGFSCENLVFSSFLVLNRCRIHSYMRLHSSAAPNLQYPRTVLLYGVSFLFSAFPTVIYRHFVQNLLRLCRTHEKRKNVCTLSCLVLVAPPGGAMCLSPVVQCWCLLKSQIARYFSLQCTDHYSIVLEKDWIRKRYIWTPENTSEYWWRPEKNKKLIFVMWIWHTMINGINLCG